MIWAKGNVIEECVRVRVLRRGVSRVYLSSTRYSVLRFGDDDQAGDLTPKT